MSEPLGLDREDVDLSQGVITIRHAKFGKSRCVPLDPSSTEALGRYQRQRERLCPHPKAPSFFLSERGTRVRERAMQWTFTKLSQEIGLSNATGRYSPRLHDLRHTFAVRTLQNWYHLGLDVNRQLPKLATYLGHLSSIATYWYLSAAPELLELAARRLEDSPEEQRP